MSKQSAGKSGGLGDKEKRRGQKTVEYSGSHKKMPLSLQSRCEHARMRA